MMNKVNDPAAWIRGFIEDLVESNENTLRNAADDPAWEKPLVGFSRGDDPIYIEMKNDIGSFFMTPPEIFARTFPSSDAGPEDLSVVSWILPQTERTKREHRKDMKHPSEE